jgi:type I restriction enzyme M protein
MLEPYEGRVFDPCCGSGGMFVQSEKFINKHQDYYKKKGKRYRRMIVNKIERQDYIVQEYQY